jgi:site-specific DNA-methyltransferase (adenine-specific)/modification methylase
MTATRFEEVTIGDCRLIHGDCREVLPLLQPVDLVLTDPPYGIGAGSGSGSNNAAKAKDYGPDTWDKEIPPLWLLELILVKGKHQIIFGGNYFRMPPTSCVLVWDKDNSGHFADAELAWTNLKKAVRLKKWRWNGMLQENMAKKEEREHPTQKPVAIMEWAIVQAPDDVLTICDPFMGSGSTGVACVNMGKRFTGIERERKYFDIACRRIEQAYAQPRLFVDAERTQGQAALI